MAKMVTRTVFSDVFTALVFDTEKKNTEEVQVIIPHKAYKSDEAKERAVKAHLDDNQKFIQIIACEQNEQTLGITIEQFMEIAVPVTRFPSQQKPEKEEE